MEYLKEILIVTLKYLLGLDIPDLLQLAQIRLFLYRPFGIIVVSFSESREVIYHLITQKNCKDYLIRRSRREIIHVQK